MLNFLKNKKTKLYNYIFINEIYYYKIIKYDFIRKIKKKIRLLKKKINALIERISDEKRFYKYLLSGIFISLFKPTPKRIFLLFKGFLIKISSYFRTSFSIFITYNIQFVNYKGYVFINLILLFLIKLLQEIFFNFTCPLATFLYGKFVKKKRKGKEDLLAKEAKKKLHKFVANPFYTKAEKAKIQAEKDRKNKEKEIIQNTDLNLRKNLGKTQKNEYKLNKNINKNIKKNIKKGFG